MNEWFRHFAEKSARAIGSPWAFVVAVAITLIWLGWGPFAGFSDTWQLVYNTITTLSTGLIVFLIQNTQNRSDAATQLKLDELIRAVEGARNPLMGLEQWSDEDIARLKDE